MASWSFQYIFIGLILLQLNDQTESVSLQKLVTELTTRSKHVADKVHVRHKRRQLDMTRPFPEIIKASETIIPQLPEEWPDPALDPKPHDLIEENLLAQLGGKFDRSYMSIEQPLESINYPRGILEYKFRKNQTPEGQEIPSEIKALEGDEIKLAKDGMALKIKFSRRTRQKLQKFLWTYSYCPVRYRWKKLNKRYWPRWVKEGACDNSRSCSIPAGMTCQPAKALKVTILRYLCLSEYDSQGNSRRVCQWRMLHYPILSECSCGCRPSR